jgi:hypothetical protein
MERDTSNLERQRSVRGSSGVGQLESGEGRRKAAGRAPDASMTLAQRTGDRGSTGTP